MVLRRNSRTIFKWMFAFSIVSLLLSLYTFHRRQELNARMPNDARVPARIPETVKTLPHEAIRAEKNTEFISLVNIFQNEGYMQRAYGPGNKEIEITWCSFCDEKHLHYVRKIAAFWDGPISIAVYTYGSKIPYALNYLAALRNCDANVRQKVSFHLCIPKAEVGSYVKNMSDDPETINITCEILQQKVDGALPNYADQRLPFPNNYLRNVALRNTNTSHVINVDIDYTPSKNLREIFLNFISVSRTTVEPKTAFVLPCFESRFTPKGSLSRDELLSRWRAGTIRPFHVKSCPRCQERTEYRRWSALKVSHKHNLSLAYYAEFTAPWEPYFIIRKDQVPAFDERFRGFGFNRVSQICEMYMSGYKFAVVDNGFLVHDGFQARTRTPLRILKLKSRAKNKVPYTAMQRELQKRYPNKTIDKCN